ncbi:thrombopoietin [Bombina bombina]|uniref:thrombopoietin n=1 Tax=Bombina bombina TaxID=8345 RepID=UPI00235AC233|nr:thrombopoietin [Bombina bombina]
MFPILKLELGSHIPEMLLPYYKVIICVVSEQQPLDRRSILQLQLIAHNSPSIKGNGVYLLIILVLCPNMSSMKPRLMCDRRLIHVYVNRTRVMEIKAAQCPDLSLLQVPITLPNVEVLLTDWSNMTEYQQGSQVLSDLNLLLNATQSTETPQCVSQQILHLARIIREARGIINKTMPFVKMNASVPHEPTLSSHNSTLDSTEIFHRFIRLLKGKVTLFMKRLREMYCR